MELPIVVTDYFGDKTSSLPKALQDRDHHFEAFDRKTKSIKIPDPPEDATQFFVRILMISCPDHFVFQIVEASLGRAVSRTTGFVIASEVISSKFPDDLPSWPWQDQGIKKRRVAQRSEFLVSTVSNPVQASIGSNNAIFADRALHMPRQIISWMSDFQSISSQQRSNLMQALKVLQGRVEAGLLKYAVINKHLKLLTANQDLSVVEAEDSAKHPLQDVTRARKQSLDVLRNSRSNWETVNAMNCGPFAMLLWNDVLGFGSKVRMICGIHCDISSKDTFLRQYITIGGSQQSEQAKNSNSDPTREVYTFSKTATGLEVLGFSGPILDSRPARAPILRSRL